MPHPALDKGRTMSRVQRNPLTDIFNEYLIQVEKQNLARPIEYTRTDECPVCYYSNVIHVQDTSELVCDACGGQDATEDGSVQQAAHSCPIE